MEVTIADVIKWMQAEIKRQEARVARLADSQKELGRQIAEQQEKKKTLTAQLKSAKDGLEKAKEEAKAEKGKMQADLQKTQRQYDVKEEIIEATKKEMTTLDSQLADARRQAEPILKEIESLQKEIEGLRDEIASKKRLVAENTEIPREIEKLRERLARALALKAGFLQKIAFAEELLNESTFRPESPEAEKLQEYRRLCEELSPMVFEE